MKLSKKLLSLLLCAIMVLGSVAIGGGGFAKVLDAFSVTASAENVDADKYQATAQSANADNELEDPFFDGIIGFFRKIFFSRISFDTDGGTQIDNIYAFKFFGRIKKPSDPVKEGYTFVEWESEIPTRAPWKNLNIKAKWSKNSYKLKWLADNEIVKEEIYSFNDKIVMPEAPDKEGYTFVCWYDAPEVMPAKDTEVAAVYSINSHCVTWVVDGLEETNTYRFGDSITRHSDPQKEGYTFVGWDKEIASVMPATDLQYTAVFNVNSYNVQLDANGGTFSNGNVSSFKVNYGESLNFATPTRPGYDFAGWDTIVPDTMPAEDISFKATWTARTDTTYTVNTYIMGTDGKYEKPQVNKYSGKTDTLVTYSPNNIEGFKLSSKSCLSTVISADESDVIEVYYDRNIYTVSFCSEGKTLLSTKYYYGQTVNAPKDPVKEYYQFVGWNPQLELTASSDKVYEAQWEKAVEETHASSFEEYESAVSELLTATFDDEDFNIEAAKEDEFYMGRLVLKGSDFTGIDFKELNADTVVYGNDGTVVVQFRDSESAQKASEYISGLMEIEYVEADAVVEIPTEVEIEDIPESTSKNWGKAYIGADKYSYYLDKNNFNDMITVAVIDTGVDTDHGYLSNRILSSGHNSIDVKSGVEDDNGHGTHVSGIIVDCTDELSNIKIMPIKALGNNGGSVLSIVNAITYAADHNVDVINLSLESIKGSYSFLIENAINKAIEKGSVVVIAAGNGTGTSHLPQNTDNVCPAYLTNAAIVVGAIDKNGNKGSFSNFGESVDVAAPGVSVYSSFLNGEYRLMSGTSQASPHIAAVAAMYKLSHPNYTPAQIEQFVKYYCRDLGEAGRDEFYGEGCPDMYSAIPDVTVSFNSNGGTVVGSATTKSSQSVTLPAISKSYKVTLNANGGSVSTSSYTSNCTFKGWCTNSSLSGTTYSANSSYSVLDSQTLYAKWSNGTLGSVATPTRTGYSFDGWYTAASGGIKYSSTTIIDSNITLYAAWGKRSLTLSSYSGSGTQAASASNTYGTGEPYCWRVELPKATATNLEDLSGTTGWVITSGSSGAYVSGSYLYMPQPGTYKLVYYYNGFESSTYTYTLSLTKTTTAANTIRSKASDTSSNLGSVPKGKTVSITKVEHMGSYSGASGYAAWGYVTYGGVSGWIILWS